MPRKSILELIAQANADFPDNVTGLVTPAKLRTWAIDFLNSIAPAYGYLTKDNPSAQILGLTPALITTTGAFDSDPSQTTSVAANSTITRAEKGTSTFQFSADGNSFKTAGTGFEAKPGRWIGAKIGFFAIRDGITNDAGTADIDWFRIEK